MTAISVRQSGGANIISIPKAITQALNLHTGSKLDLSLEDNKIVLTPITEQTSLEELLAGSPQACFQLSDEDKEWLDEKPTGREQ